MKIRQKRVLAYVLAMVMVLNLCAVPVKAEGEGAENSLTTNISNSTMYFVYDSAKKVYSYSLTITKDEAVDDITLDDVSKLGISTSNDYDSSPIAEKTYTATGDTSLKAGYITSKPIYDNDFTIDGNSTDGFSIQLSDEGFSKKQNNSFILWCQNDNGNRWYYVATFEVSIKEYKINYNLGENGNFKNEGTAQKVFYEGDKVTLPTEENIVAKDGYTFAGWYLNEEYDGGSVKEITKDKADKNKTVTLYAKWEQKTTYSIKYQLDDTNSETKSSTDIEELKKDVSAKKTAKTGYTFGGWYMQTDSGNVDITAENLEGNLKANTNITLYPKWYYTIKFKTNTAGTVDDKKVEISKENSDAALSSTVTMNKYKFAGWYVKGTENKVDTIKDVTEKRDNNSDTVTLEAKWSFTIRFENATFSDSNKYPSNSKEYYYGKEVSLPTQSEMTNAGEFQGWYTDESFTNSVEKITESLAADNSSEFTLYAKWISTSPSPSPSDNSLNPSPSPTKDPSPSVAPAPTVTPSVQPTESTDGIKINGKDVKNNQKISVSLGTSITITASSKITIVPKAKKNQKKCLKVSVKNNKGTIKVNSLCKNAIKVIITEKSKKTSTTIWINTKVPTPKFKVKINKSRTKFTITIKNKSVAKKIGCYTVEAKNKNTKNKFVYIATDKFKVVTSGGKKYPEGKYSFRITFWNTKKPVKKGKFINKYMHQSQVFNLTVKRK